MPSVMDTPELMEDVATHDLAIQTIERPQPRQVRPGFWRTLAHTSTTDLTPTSPAWHEGACQISHPFQTPIDRLAREHPFLAAYALAIIG
jgi:hypothetical protein